MRSYKAARRAAKREEGGSEPIPFEVTYYDEADEEVTETFQAYGEASGGALADFGYYAEASQSAESAEGGALIRQVFTEVIGDPDEFARFWRVSRFVTMETLVEIMGGLIEDTTGRPTTRPSISSGTSSTTGQGSKVVVLQGGFLTEAQPLETTDVDPAVAVHQQRAASSA